MIETICSSPVLMFEAGVLLGMGLGGFIAAYVIVRAFEDR